MSLTENLRRVPVLPSIVRNGRDWRTRMTDRRLNIRTELDRDVVKPAFSQFNDHREYESMDYPCIRTFLKALRVGPEDTVYDIGCGKGRIVCVAARLGVRKCVGVDICEELAEQARQNARTLRAPKSPIEIRAADAAAEDYSDGTVFCLFTPFGEQTLRQVLQRIHRSLDASPRHIRIGYASPNHGDVLRHERWLHQYGELRFLTHRYCIDLWENLARSDSSVYFG